MDEMSPKERWLATIHIQPVDRSELPHHRGVAITSAGVMPPLCKPETIRQVCEWVRQYPARMAAAA